MESERNWGFGDISDASAYLREVGRLWAIWVVGLVGLVTGRGLLLVGLGIAVLGALLWAARPLQVRAMRLVPEDSVVSGGRSLLVGRRTERDLVLRQLAYGAAPLRAAIGLTGSPGWWLATRWVVLGLTVAAFGFVLMSWTLGAAPS